MVKHTIQTFARIKPTRKTAGVYSVDNEDQISSSLEFVVPRDLAQGFINNKKESYKFRFQKIFDQSAKQEDIFESIAKPVADSVLAGYNGTIFAYGQTGSGKTFTITGGAEHYSDRGIIPRTLSYLYERFSQESSMVYTIHISYLEIYNDTGYDLLESRQDLMSRLEDLPKVRIQEDLDQNVHLKNLSMLQSANEEEALNLLFLGDTNRMIAETPMNQASTRSHCIFTVHLCRREPGSAMVRRSKLHLVDLAGSDRVYKTGLNGQLLTEAKYINLSLHYLEQVIIALSEKNRSHIPYRNSMLTSVLRDSLGGNCMTTLIATMAVDKRNIDESISTCRFAQRVALIKNEAILNEELDPALLIARLKKEVQSLKEELSLVTGVQRHDQLTGDEIHKLEELLETFLDDPDPEVTLNLGSDMRKIQHCFYQLKVNIVCQALYELQLTSDIQESQQCAAEVTKLKEMLTQRDSEISPKLSMGKREAFEIFLRDHEDHLTIEENKTQLKQRLDKCFLFDQSLLNMQTLKTNIPIGDNVKATKFSIIAPVYVLDPVEEELRTQIEKEKKIYKSTIDRLKALRTEIEHLQLLLERAKVKLQRDFQKWWSEEASCRARDLDYPTYSAEGFRSAHLHLINIIYILFFKVTYVNSLCLYSRSPTNLSTTSITSSSIPLTGDKKADADIMAFVKARERLLQKNSKSLQQLQALISH
uniref:Kinesin motor domain-containing protein n=1 Tax=Periophthalmus magnuspinnatus TaxID=409849 RepID=A0A3B3ZSD2_9GOBI